ncbi:MAG: STAS domain-containing protein [Burkholderiales bacterium]
MNAAAEALSIEHEQGRLRVRGSITMDNAATALQQALACSGQGEMVVDLAGVGELDSSAVSLLLEWRRQAERSACKLSFENLPDSLLSLARLYDVLDLIQPAPAA